MEPLVLRLGLALAIGLLVGLERGWREREAPAGSRTAGIRTYGISGLLGGIVMALGQAADNLLVLPLGLLGFALVFGWFKWRESEHDEDFSAPSAKTAIAAVQASREMLHEWLKRLTWIELRSALILAVMTAVVLPLLPDRPLDPWGAINPHEIWIFTILMGAFSYFGYIMTRIAGPARGLIFSTLAGALVSSTAMTLSLARAEGDPIRRAGAACLAALVSILRVLAYAAVIGPAIVVQAGPAALAAAIVFALAGWLLLMRAAPAEAPEQNQRNPLEFKPILASAVVLAVMALFSAVSSRYFGQASLPVTAAIAAMADVDAAVLSMLRLQGGSVPPGLLGLAVLSAFASNAVVRLASAAVIAPRSFSLPLGAATLAALLAGFLVYRLLPAAFSVSALP